MNKLIQLDKELFHLINGKWHNSMFDTIMPLLRSSQFWVPLYLFLLLFALFNFKKNVWWWAAMAGFTAILSNFISSDLIKENIWRVRPCNDPELVSSIRFLLNYRPQSSSFTSSHAVNHFALATYFFFTLKNHVGKWAGAFFLWAFIIIYAQVYVGVHFPLDVICGALIGIILGYLSARSFTKNYGLA
jgi:undecaprenyl-diphosphatase